MPVRPADADIYDPTKRWFRVNLAQEERSYPTEKLLHLYRHFGLTVDQAKNARRCGYFCPNANRPFESSVDEEVFAELMEEAIRSAEAGADDALRKTLGWEWRTRLRGMTFEDVVAAALEVLRHKSGLEEFRSERWRRVTAKYGALSFLTQNYRKQKREKTTVDRLEGRFDEEDR